MRSCLLSLLALGVLACAGCEAMPGRMRDRFEAPQPQVRVYEVDSRAAFDAAQLALRRMDFRVTRAGAAQGTVKAISRIQPGEAFGTGRQYAIDISLRDLDPARTEVSVVLREQEESTSFAGATDIPLREHALYDAFFSGVARALTERAPAAKKTP